MSAALSNVHTSPTLAPRRVVIFGATGGTGRELVAQALARGYAVTAFVRDPAKVTTAHPRLSVVAGDVTDAASVQAAIASHDAVISALGSGARDKSRLREKSHAHIIAGMTAEGVERLVTLSLLGLGDSHGNLTAVIRFLVFPFYLRQALKDHAAQERLVQQSDLAWTIVRPPYLNNGPANGTYRHGFDGAAKGLTLKVSRADTAAFMLDQLTDATYVRRAASISN